VSYDAKHNETNKEDDLDGFERQFQLNCGGKTDRRS